MALGKFYIQCDKAKNFYFHLKTYVVTKTTCAFLDENRLLPSPVSRFGNQSQHILKQMTSCNITRNPAKLATIQNKCFSFANQDIRIQVTYFLISLFQNLWLLTLLHKVHIGIWFNSPINLLIFYFVWCMWHKSVTSQSRLNSVAIFDFCNLTIGTVITF